MGTQIVAGILAAFTYVAIFKGETYPLQPGAGYGEAAMADIVFTFVQCFVVLSVATVQDHWATDPGPWRRRTLRAAQQRRALRANLRGRDVREALREVGAPSFIGKDVVGIGPFVCDAQGQRHWAPRGARRETRRT